MIMTVTQWQRGVDGGSRRPASGVRFDTPARTRNPGRVKAGVGVLAVWSFTAGFGCGGDRNDACGRTQPCGGDPLGRWTIEDHCSSGSPAANVVATAINGSCPGMTIDAIEHAQSGTLTFAADMTYTATSSMITQTFRVTLPASCTGGVSCATIGALFTRAGLSDVPCTGSSSCTCDVVLGSSFGGPGTYAVAGTTLMLRPQNGPGLGWPYCVDGPTMHLMALDGTDIVDDVVLAKQ
jgi:hypothetical protein